MKFNTVCSLICRRELNTTRTAIYCKDLPETPLTLVKRLQLILQGFKTRRWRREWTKMLGPSQQSGKALTEVTMLELSSVKALWQVWSCILGTRYYHSVLILKLIPKLHTNVLSEFQISALDISVSLHPDWACSRGVYLGWSCVLPVYATGTQSQLVISEKVIEKSANECQWMEEIIIIILVTTPTSMFPPWFVTELILHVALVSPSLRRQIFFCSLTANGPITFCIY